MNLIGKTILISMLTATMVFGVPSQAFAEESTQEPGTTEEPEITEDPNLVDSGCVISDETGDSYTYKVIKEVETEEETSYKLVIGEGVKMPDFTKDFKAPWYAYRNEIHTVVIESGITYVGKYTFYSLDYLEEIDISKDVKTVGDHAFDTRDCCDAKIKFSPKIRKIGAYGFAGLDRTDAVLTLPAGLETVGSHAFNNCQDARKVVFPKSIKSIGTYMVSEWDCVGSVQYKGTKKQLYGVNVKKTGNRDLLNRKITCSNGKTYFENNFKTIKVTYKKDHLYTGKPVTPKVTVKDASGTTLKKGTHYKVTYSGKHTKYGTWEIDISPVKSSKYMGEYKSLKYTIKPKKVKITGYGHTPDGWPIVYWKVPNVKTLEVLQIQWSHTKDFKKKKSWYLERTFKDYKDWEESPHGQTLYARVRAVGLDRYDEDVYSEWTTFKVKYK